MLSEEEAKALERMSSEETAYSLCERDEYYIPTDYMDDLRTLSDAVARLYPPGWDEPVTPERLVELGFESSGHDTDSKWFSHPNCNFAIVIRNDGQNWIYHDGEFQSSMFDPRNMKEVRELLERCGAIKETTND